MPRLYFPIKPLAQSSDQEDPQRVDHEREIICYFHNEMENIESKMLVLEEALGYPGGDLEEEMCEEEDAASIRLE